MITCLQKGNVIIKCWRSVVLVLTPLVLTPLLLLPLLVYHYEAKVSFELFLGKNIGLN